jgi:hypothetical protein
MDNGAVSDRASDTVEYSGRYPSWFLRANLSAPEAEAASRALVFERCAENSCARPHLRSRLVRLVQIRPGALPRGGFRQLPSPISISSHHQKLALPVEAVLARVWILFVWAWQAPGFCFLTLKIVERVVFPSPINNGRFFQDAG